MAISASARVVFLSKHAGGMPDEESKKCKIQQHRLTHRAVHHFDGLFCMCARCVRGKSKAPELSILSPGHRELPHKSGLLQGCAHAGVSCLWGVAGKQAQTFVTQCELPQESSLLRDCAHAGINRLCIKSSNTHTCMSSQHTLANTHAGISHLCVGVGKQRKQMHTHAGFICLRGVQDLTTTTTTTTATHMHHHIKDQLSLIAPELDLAHNSTI
eukprot:1159328-Pelagomonas_calceolata.AAC.12